MLVEAKTVYQAAELLDSNRITAEEVWVSLRHAVPCANEKGRSKEKTAQRKRAHGRLLVALDHQSSVISCVFEGGISACL